MRSAKVTVCGLCSLRERIILPIAVAPGFLGCMFKDRNPGAKANAPLLQTIPSSPLLYFFWQPLVYTEKMNLHMLMVSVN
ncbi:hypothetical protein [Paenibacillus sp. BT-177]|uniref:hypothetical protein n=1 Tax=Paenibacillus sp. BT-177 TaxID=2986930 RepID=UPI0021F6DF9E|nr:hypothetical protein [Paenibacillus sp. BT-177]